MSKFPKFLMVASVAALTAAPAMAEKLGLGRAATEAEVAAWDLDIFPDGSNLPAGKGDVWTGEEVFADACAVCHGEFAEGAGNWPKLAGGADTLDHEDPLKTVGSYWPYLSTTFDYVRRSMPFGAAGTLSDDDVYAIVAYILYSNDLVDDDFVLSKETFSDVVLPNAEGFIVDDRAETEYGTFTNRCMSDCKPGAVEITTTVVFPGDPNSGFDATPISQAVMGTAGATPDAAASTEEASAEDAPAEETAVVGEVAAPAVMALDEELVAKGEKVFKKCKACHKVGDKAKNGTGPILNGVFGRAAGTVDGFKYSKPMLAAAEGGLVWDETELSGYLANPRKYMKGTKMSFAGLKKDKDVAAILEFLKSHSQ
ncbi:sulfur dehydrogenase subunit SoxD [Aliiroseovarius halocynthiae]|uniref:C-type cytochrome n=1 Tax=Aliiroseovarius halocynthiae TaxID=985055 RepID=A0A545SVQ7_9RHOB|nr:c-type cytochrome [Aliiroseovarius halocynthiae]TQV69045.1 c-type cytochrome [Aliiroseovarius halocynthiae]SMR71797.1 sulfur dehydrogenase subunit SoxD [Aliiroseovarius halocynthiae]